MPRRGIPSYRLHKPSQQAIVTLPYPGGRRKDEYLGPYNSPESREAYARVIAEWEARNRTAGGIANDLTIDELVLAYWKHAESHYRHADGAPTSEIHCQRAAIRPLSRRYGDTLAKDFGPAALKAVRQDMIQSKDKRTGKSWSRRSINLHISRIRGLFRWGVAEELVPTNVLEALKSVPGLQRGRSTARECEPVKPVPDEFVLAALDYLAPQVRDMVELQQVTGMRPGEFVIMRTVDIDTRGKVWLYRPEHHKTERHDQQRFIAIGPRGQAILRQRLREKLHEYLFQPTEAMDWWHARRRRQRKTKVQPSQRNRRKRVVKAAPGDKYSVASYRYAICRAIHKVNEARQLEGMPEIPAWTPHRLRHNFATEVRARYGLESAQVLLGHARADVTQVYAERNLSLAERVAAEIG